ncbi:MAG: antibiotic biosynthesis monooxygenase [Planctomycetia bacterium]|nr:antibiotic biosynthesis monooxygenase [Planctomycetia bacterium]
MIHVLATIEIAAGQRDAFLAEFRKIVPLVGAEPGCLEYGPAIDLTTSIPNQAGPRENAVTVIEKWASVSALEKHLVAPHMVEYRGKVKGMVVRSDLRILEPA